MKTKYICGWATVRTEDSEEEHDGYLILSQRKAFDKDGHGDEDIGEDIAVLLQKYGVYGADESSFEIPKGKKEELKTALTNDPQIRSLVEYSRAFQKSLVPYDSIYDFEFDRDGV